MSYLLIDEISAAKDRIDPFILQTPCIRSNYLSDLTGGNIYLKCENEQVTASFKIRGGLNKILKNKGKSRIITASTGNHGLGVAHALNICHQEGIVFVPEHISPSKLDRLKSYQSVEILKYGKDSLEAELYAKNYAFENNYIWISPYNDPDVIAGQGTIGLELLSQISTIDYLFIAVGGGGLISGVGTWMKKYSPSTKIIGCQPKNSPEMCLSIENDSITSLPEYIPTLSDSTAGGIEEEAITFELCKMVIDEFALIEESQIARSIYESAEYEKKMIEGAAAVAVAACKQYGSKLKGKSGVVVLCGANISTKSYTEILTTFNNL